MIATRFDRCEVPNDEVKSHEFLDFLRKKVNGIQARGVLLTGFIE